MPWTNIPDFVVGDPVRAIDGVALRDNIPALANGDSGAPQVQTAAIANNAVTTAKIAAGAVRRTQIANATASLSGSTSGSSNTNIVLSDWALFPMIHTTANCDLQGHPTDGGSASSPRFTFGFGTGSYDVDYRYII